MVTRTLKILQCKCCNILKVCLTILGLFPLKDETYSSRSSPPLVFLGKGALKICSSKFTEHLCRCVISMKLLYNFKDTHREKFLLVVAILFVLTLASDRAVSNGNDAFNLSGFN